MNGCPEEYQDHCECRERDCYCRHPNVGDVVSLSTGKDCCPRIDDAVFLSDYNEIKAKDDLSIYDDSGKLCSKWKDVPIIPNEVCAGKIGQTVYLESDGGTREVISKVADKDQLFVKSMGFLTAQALDDLKYKAAKYDELKALVEWEKECLEAVDWFYMNNNSNIWCFIDGMTHKTSRDISVFLRNMIE